MTTPSVASFNREFFDTTVQPSVVVNHAKDVDTDIEVDIVALEANSLQFGAIIQPNIIITSTVLEMGGTARTAILTVDHLYA